MFFKAVIFAASCILSASAVPVLAPSYAHGPGIAYASPAYAAPAYAAPAYAAPAHYAPAVAAVAKVPIYPDSVPNYSFGYAVADPHTGDVKEQQETRHGDAVQGSYALNEPDGTRRVVHYTADDHNGFNAVVEHQGAPVKAVVAAPVVKAVAPAVYAAPAHYAAPAYAPAHYAAPAYAPAHYAAPAAVAVSHYAPHGGYHY